MIDTVIDRARVVGRHAVRLDGMDHGTALQLGNGEFAYSVDFTGAQSFPRQWQVPLSTMAQWGWHCSPNPQGHRLEDAMQSHAFQGRVHAFASRGWPQQGEHPASDWLNANPHRFHLGDVGLAFKRADGTTAAPEDFTDATQQLDLWTGTLHSRYRLDGQWVEVTTQVHPRHDLVSVKLRSPLLAAGRIKLRLAWPGIKPDMSDMRDWSQAQHPEPQRESAEGRRWRVERVLDDTRILLRLASNIALQLSGGTDETLLQPAGGVQDWELQFGFADATAGTARTLPAALPSCAEVDAATRTHWRAFWEGGAAIDFSGSTDPRATELERRVVQSRYLMAIQACGSLPPQETGLSSTSWFGKFHLEMHWWHAAHFALWGQPQLLQRSLDWYVGQLPAACERAAALGLRGARWPKMCGPEGRESPGAINPFILWQQPHPIHLAELVWRARPHADVLQQYASLVQQTAEGLATTLSWDGTRFVIGPPVVPMQEAFDADATLNPAFELAYFHFGLTLAQRWRERLGLAREPAWDHILANLSALPTHDGVYVPNESDPLVFEQAEACEDCRDSGQPLGIADLFQRRCRNLDHPSFCGVLGFLPGWTADAATLRHTLERVLRSWNLSKMWGWDYPFLAMSAARSGRPDMAIDFLFHDSPVNRWAIDGKVRWNFMHDYLPANGALLATVALMAGGWDGADGPAPGLPKDGSWQVRAEGFVAAP